MLLKAAAVIAALLAVFIYRSGRVAWYHILTAPNLPEAYYIGGNWTAHCDLIQDPSSNDLHSCEDIVFWDRHDTNGTLTDRRLLIGCDPGRKAWNTVMGPLRDPNPRGHLFLYTPRTRAVRRVHLVDYPPTHDFHPLGMDISPVHDDDDDDDDGSSSARAALLYVVNHARAQTTIERFALDPARPTEARYLGTLRSPRFVSPNALALVGPTRFYVSNDHAWTRRLEGWAGRIAPLVETVAGLPLSWVADVSVHQGEEEEEEGGAFTHTVAARRIPFANGVARSPSGTHLAVAATSLGLVYIYAIGDGGTLSLSHSVPVPFFPDNVAYDDDGVLIVAGHPHFPTLVDMAANKTQVGPRGTRNAPSWVVALTPTTTAQGSVYDTRAPLSASLFAPAVDAYAVETLFQSDGSVFGSSSTALRDTQTGAIYVAGLYEQGVLVCRP